MVNRKQLAEAKRMLENYGYTVLPPEETEIRTADFEEFWELYQKKVEKDRCLRLWAKMSEDDKKACIKAVPLYVASTADKKYRKNPSTYLNNRCWNDEIIGDSKEQQRQQRLSESAALVAKYGKKA